MHLCAGGFFTKLLLHVNGLVIKNTGSWYLVKCDDGAVVSCKIKGNFRLKGIRSTNPVAVGDRVQIEGAAEGSAYITHIEDRRNYIVRKASNLSKLSHILAANLDQVLLIVTINHPETNTVFIDRFLATSEAYRVPAVLLFNKTDRYDEWETNYMKALVNLYEGIGYPCLCISAIDPESVKEARKTLQGKVSLVSGNSGVGKSTFINAIFPDLALRTESISEHNNKGTHTTTFSEMFELPEGGYLIDTPGIKGFGTVGMKATEIAHYFREIFKVSPRCRFNNCTHIHEPGCAVREAVELHTISESRYTSYVNIIEDCDEGKYRE